MTACPSLRLAPGVSAAASPKSYYRTPFVPLKIPFAVIFDLSGPRKGLCTPWHDAGSGEGREGQVICLVFCAGPGKLGKGKGKGEGQRHQVFHID